MPDDEPLGPDDPRRLGDYVLIGRLGEGGQGVVYLGRTRDDGLVAIKLLRGTTARARARFVREADTARRVAAPYTARVIDADVTGDRPYIVSEFVEGPSLQHVVEDRGPLSGSQLTRLAVRTAGALAAIHRAGVVHRDVKPGNVLLGPGGAKVIDFGVARVAAYGEPVTTNPVGTPAYMAPEQFEDEPPGAAADVFAWAATVTYAATGRPPFGTGPATAVMHRIRSSAPDLTGLTGPLRRIVADCLAKEPRNRPTSAELVHILRDRRAARRPARSRPVPARHFGRRMLIAMAAVIVLGFVVGLLVPVGG
ncbi:MAG TPA: serine/threonine-protein kinase [Streptosporangiaceae bacterium]|jgi:serine/threonine protein kinase